MTKPEMVIEKQGRENMCASNQVIRARTVVQVAMKRVNLEIKNFHIET